MTARLFSISWTPGNSNKNGNKASIRVRVTGMNILRLGKCRLAADSYQNTLWFSLGYLLDQRPAHLVKFLNNSGRIVFDITNEQTSWHKMAFFPHDAKDVTSTQMWLTVGPDY